MMMQVYEYNVYAKEKEVAGFDDVTRAECYARMVAHKEHCDVDVINAFTGEIHWHAQSYVHVTYNADMEEIETHYVVKEGWAD